MQATTHHPFNNHPSNALLGREAASFAPAPENFYNGRIELESMWSQILSKSVSSKEPIRWTGVMFAFAANLLLVTVADYLGGAESSMAPTVLAPLVAGAATALYVKTRGGIHAFIGAAIALPVLAFVTFPDEWPLAVFATLFCVLGATLTELGLRSPSRRK
jgi:hypothetical protein